VKSNKRDRAIVLTTHSMEEAEMLCDRLGIFVDGRLVCIGNPKEITSRYGGFLVRGGAGGRSTVVLGGRSTVVLRARSTLIVLVMSRACCMAGVASRWQLAGVGAANSRRSPADAAVLVLGGGGGWGLQVNCSEYMLCCWLSRCPAKWNSVAA
jgi:hypothetical protein